MNKTDFVFIAVIITGVSLLLVVIIGSHIDPCFTVQHCVVTTQTVHTGETTTITKTVYQP